jgi:hypothetical protein
VLDHRVYRAAFVPALVALFIVAFSLTDPAAPRTTLLAPDAFDGQSAYGAADPPPRDSLRELAQAFPDRRPGSAGDNGLAGRVAQAFRATGFATPADIRRDVFPATTVDGRRDLQNVVATRQGLSSHTIVVIAHRDAPRGPAVADLSATATLIELARLLADRDLRKTVVLASVSGGSGGFDGARELAERAPGPVDAVLVLGDLAARNTRRPFVVPWSDGTGPAPYGLQRTAEVGLKRQVARDPGQWGATAQWIRRALPLTLSEQGVVGAAGLPAVLISATGERRAAADAPVSEHRMVAFGRGVLRTLTAALDAGGIEEDPVAQRDVESFPGGTGIVVWRRLVPDWAIRLLVAALLLPALAAGLDAFFRARRRGLPMARWTLWAASFALVPLVAWGWARLLAVVQAVPVLGAPAAEGVLALRAPGILGLVSVAVVAVGTAFGLRPMLLRRLGARGDAATGGAAAATGLGLAVLVALVWLRNPYAAVVLVPAAHAWLLVTAAGGSVRRRVAGPAVAIGLLLPLLVAGYYVHAWGLGPVQALWTGFGLVAGGVLGVGAALALSAFGAALAATVAIVAARRRAAPATTDEPVVTRGPQTYAGPGSLGGTESALRR